MTLAAAAGEVRSICPYCGVGCGVRIAHAGGRIAAVIGDESHPANHGRLCSKGMTLAQTLSRSTRAHVPELRPTRGVARMRASWDEALDAVADRFAASIREHGPDSVAFYLSGQLLTEDYYAFNKLAKGLVGTNNVDTNSRLCMSSAVAGYKQTLGADAPPACYDDIELADCVFIAGSNTAFAHPVLYRRLEDAKRRRPSTRVIVVDPRRTDTAADADLHLALAPGSDVALFNAMLHVMIAEGLVDRAYIARATEGFDELEREVAAWTPARAAEVCELEPADIVAAARMFATSASTLSLYCQGLNQSTSGTAKNAALIHLHLATGQIGRPGAGPFSLTGQPNAMGGREVGGMANLLSGHRELSNPRDRDDVARLWGVPSVPAARGLTAVELFDALADGRVRCVWIVCTNPAQSMPDQARVRAALARAELVVVQDCWRDVETAAFADVLLPASSWGEKDGTVTNSERRISRVRAAVAPPGEARADWAIASDFARRLGARLGRDDAARMFAWPDAAAVFDEHRATTVGRDLDIGGLDYARLERDGPQQWPYPAGASEGRARLYADARFPTPSGRARFVAVPYTGTAEAPDDRHPLRLMSGRLRDQWHSMSRTGRVPSLHRHEAEPLVTMHPRDMDARGIVDGAFVRVRSQRGSMTLRARRSEDLRAGDAFVPMHWGSRWMAGLGVNALTLRAFDPASFQPELKHAVVEIEALALPHTLVAMGVLADADLALERLANLLNRFDYASCGLAGRDYAVTVLRAASAVPIPDALLDEVDAVFGVESVRATLSYEDRGAGIVRVARKLGHRLAAVRLSGDATGADWLAEWLAEGRSVVGFGYAILAPSPIAPGGGDARGRVLCTCHDVPERDVRAAFDAGAGLAEVQRSLKCGTGCGSCVPALRRLERAAREVTA